MALKTPGQLLKDLIGIFVSQTEKVTSFGKDGIVRGIFHSVSNVVSEMWNDLYQTKRQMQLTTAEGNDLIEFGERRGVPKNAAAKSSVVLIFNGPDNTVISAGTNIKSIIDSSIVYTTKVEITLGSANPNIVRPIKANSIGDIVIAESVATGSQTSVDVNELTVIDPEIAGVTVTNLVPSSGGKDIESDDEYRERIKNIIDSLAQGTQAFYEALAMKADSTVMKAKAIKSQYGGVDVYLVKNSLGDYDNSELSTIASYIYDYQKAFQNISCKNAIRRSIEVRGKFLIKSGYTNDQVFSAIASKIASYISGIFKFTTTVKFIDLVNEIAEAEGLTSIDLSNFYLNGAQADIYLTSVEVPVFTHLLFIDSFNNVIEEDIEQAYLII